MNGLPEDSQTLKWIRLFLSIIRAAYLGERFLYEGKTYDLEPTLVRPSDFYRRILHPSTQYEALLSSLDPTFKSVASSEVYRVRKGWVSQGLKGHEGLKIRRVKIGKDIFLLPVISDNPTVGIDTSTIQPGNTVVAFCFLPDPAAAYTYLERHLKLPKTHNHQEFKWRKLNPEEKEKVFEKLGFTLSMFCNGILIIETNTLASPQGKLQDVFINLIEGCFSGYERDPKQQKLRPSLRSKLFSLANSGPIHCDADFRPLAPNKVVRYFVQTLSKRNSYFERFVPLFADLKSHESETLQVADIIVGAIRTKIRNQEPLHPLTNLPFDARKIKHYKGRFAKAYYFFP